LAERGMTSLGKMGQRAGGGKGLSKSLRKAGNERMGRTAIQAVGGFWGARWLLPEQVRRKGPESTKAQRRNREEDSLYAGRSEEWRPSVQDRTHGNAKGRKVPFSSQEGVDDNGVPDEKLRKSGSQGGTLPNFLDDEEYRGKGLL